MVPSTGAGETYMVHVVASNNTQAMLGCTLPLGAASCIVVKGEGN